MRTRESIATGLQSSFALFAGWAYVAGFSGILAEQGKRQSWCCGASGTTAIRSEVFIPGSTGSHLQLSSQEP